MHMSRGPVRHHSEIDGIEQLRNPILRKVSKVGVAGVLGGKSVAKGSSEQESHGTRIASELLASGEQEIDTAFVRYATGVGNGGFGRGDPELFS